ncbi:MAG: YCF48-related protein [Parvibaculum sp.]
MKVSKFISSAAVALSLAVTPVLAQDEDVNAGEFNGKPILLSTPSALAAHKLLIDVVRTEARIVAVGEFGHVVYSDDDGATWKQASRVETQVTLTSVAFPTKDIGYAVGHDSMIVKTVDGGDTWRLVHEDFEAESPLLTVFFMTPDHGIAMGAFGYMLETTDAGETWEQRQIIEGGEDDFHLNDSFRDKSGSIWVAAEFGTVYRSDDEGATFARLQTPYEGSFWGGLGVSDGSVLIFGMRGNVFRTVDKGETWTKIDTGVTKSFGGATQLANGTVVLAGLSGAIAFSTDLGQSFETVSRADREGYSAVIEIRNDQIAIFGESGVKRMPNNAAAAMGEGGTGS